MQMVSITMRGKDREGPSSGKGEKRIHLLSGLSCEVAKGCSNGILQREMPKSGAQKRRLNSKIETWESTV